MFAGVLEKPDMSETFMLRLIMDGREHDFTQNINRLDITDNHLKGEGNGNTVSICTKKM